MHRIIAMSSTCKKARWEHGNIRGKPELLLGWILSRSRKLRGEHLLTFRDPDVGWGDQTLGRQPPGLLLGLVELDI